MATEQFPINENPDQYKPPELKLVEPAGPQPAEEVEAPTIGRHVSEQPAIEPNTHARLALHQQLTGILARNLDESSSITDIQQAADNLKAQYNPALGHIALLRHQVELAQHKNAQPDQPLPDGIVPITPEPAQDHHPIIQLENDLHQMEDDHRARKDELTRLNSLLDKKRQAAAESQPAKPPRQPSFLDRISIRHTS